MTARFYEDLPPLPAALAMCGGAHHTPLPAGWCVAVADIANSTQAITEGKYKDVNTVASCAIIAVLNALGRMKVPYMFGGDGATILLPDTHRLAAAQALYGTQAMARAQFGIEMRAGLVPLAALGPVMVAKIETAPGVYQAALSGPGVAQAEALLKSTATYALEALYDATTLAAAPPSFEGLECRWQPLKSRNGEDVSLIVQARGGDDATALYRSILDEIETICGPQESWRPADPATLAVSVDPTWLMREAQVRTHDAPERRLRYLARAVLLSAFGKLCFLLGHKAGHFDGKTYKRDTAMRSDYIKFDSALRLVMDINPLQKTMLERYLDGLHAQARVFYGMFGAPSALMTCMVFDYHDAHFHFIDAADGGYAMAAKQLKAQIQAAI